MERAPASANVPLQAIVPPSMPDGVAVSDVIDGATLFTVRSKVVSAGAPSLSVAVMVTAPPWAGPSMAGSDQLQVPSGFAVTSPTEAATVTASPPGSKKLPLLVAI